MNLRPMNLASVFRQYLQYHLQRGLKSVQALAFGVKEFLRFQRQRGKAFDQLHDGLLLTYSRQRSYSEKRAYALRSWLRYLYRHGFLLRAWHERVYPPKFKLKQLRAVPSHREVLALFERLSKDSDGVMERALFEIAYGSGLRASELINLDLCDLRWAEGQLVVRKTKNQWERVVPLTGWALWSLNQYLSQVRPGRCSSLSGNALWLRASGRRLARQDPTQALRDYGAGFTLHVLRHACATRLLEAGASLRLVQELLGHRCLNSTQIYARLSPVHLCRVHQRCHPRSLVFGQMLPSDH